MADLNDVVTVQKNGVVAINNLNQTEANAWIDSSVSPTVPYLKTISDSIAVIAGGTTSAVTSETVAIDTLIIAGSGSLLNFSVVLPGSAHGIIYNAATIGGASSTNSLVMTPVTAGVYNVGQIRFTNGLVISPGTSQTINVTYSLDA